MEEKDKEIRPEEQVNPEDPGMTAETEETASGSAEEDTPENAAPEEAAAEEAAPEEQDSAEEAGKASPEQKKIEELTDRLQRTMAEFDNFRKRTEKEKAAMYDIGARAIIEKILPVLDNFERGLATVSEEEVKTPFAEGMEKIYKQFVKTLEDIGVVPIDAAGKPFDPNLHNAVMHVEDDSLGENVVAEEFQKGYLYHDSVVRHSMVKVAN